jgi:hypothetical protein
MVKVDGRFQSDLENPVEASLSRGIAMPIGLGPEVAPRDAGVADLFVGARPLDACENGSDNGNFFEAYNRVQQMVLSLLVQSVGSR